MQTHLARKSRKYLFCYFLYFLSLFGQFCPVWRLLFMENFIHGKFYLVQRILCVKNLIKSTVDTFIQCQDFYLIQCVDFYLVQRLLFSVDTFIQCRYFCPVQILLSSAQTFFLNQTAKNSAHYTETRNLERNSIIVKEYIKHFLKELTVFYLFS